MGFSIAQLARDVDLVLVAPEDLQDRRLPFGRLREPASALARADAVHRRRRAGCDDVARAAGFAARPSSTLRRSLGAPAPIEPERAAGRPLARRVVAFAGIAAPERFQRALEAPAGRSRGC